MAPPASEDIIDVPTDEAMPSDEAAPTDEAPASEPVVLPTPTAVPAPPAPSLPPIPGVQDVQITLRDDFTITLSSSTVRAGRARFIITNEGRLTHGLSDGLSVEQFVPPGGTLTREVNLPAGRTLMLSCPVADHASRGMRAQLVVQ